MKHKIDSDELLSDLIAESVTQEFRTDSLNTMLSCARRRRRHRRQTRFVAGTVAPLAVIFATLNWMKPREAEISPQSIPIAASSAESRTIEGTNIRIVTDDELFAMFPNRPLAVIGTDEDRRLVFLDEVE